MIIYPKTFWKYQIIHDDLLPCCRANTYWESIGDNECWKAPVSGHDSQSVLDGNEYLIWRSRGKVRGFQRYGQLHCPRSMDTWLLFRAWWMKSKGRSCRMAAQCARRARGTSCDANGLSPEWHLACRSWLGCCSGSKTHLPSPYHHSHLSRASSVPLYYCLDGRSP